ncbi:TPA: DinQ-like type I toxin DqlB [Klebsiella aerogenes]|nr:MULTISPECIES: DinQ-like type I toxin DqlB [Enterobacteriaceae]
MSNAVIAVLELIRQYFD